MTTRPLSQLICNPWAYCTSCGDGVELRAAGRNLPCRCLAEVASQCPTWDLYYGCQCSTIDEAEAFAAAVDRAQLEQTAAAERLAIVHQLPARPAPAPASVRRTGVSLRPVAAVLVLVAFVVVYLLLDYIGALP